LSAAAGAFNHAWGEGNARMAMNIQSLI